MALEEIEFFDNWLYTNDKKFDHLVGACVVGQVKIPTNDKLAKYRYVLCKGTPFIYRHFLGVTAYDYKNIDGVFLSADKFDVNENTTHVHYFGLTSTCFPEYNEPTGTCYTNIFDDSEWCLFDEHGKYMPQCVELDYSPFRPVILRLFGEPEEFNLYSSIKIDKTLPLSSALVIANRMDILNNGQFNAYEVKDVLVAVQKEPNKFGFEENVPQKKLGTK